MAVKMNMARLISNNEEVTVNDIFPSDNGNLKCLYCDAKVSYVEAYPRETKKGRTYVNAFLRLSRNEHHGDECKYNVENLIEKLVAESKDIEEDSIFITDDNSIHSFRLHMLLEAIEKSFDNDFNNKSISENGNDDILGYKYTKVNKTLSSYIKSASGIAKLKQIVDGTDAQKLKESIKLIFNGKNISWNDFFYESNRYIKLFKKIESKQLSHPIAIQVTIKSETQEKLNSKYKYSTQCFAGDKVNGESNNHVEIPWIITSDSEIASQLKVDATYIVVTKPFAYASNNKVQFSNIYLPIVDKSQIKYIGMASPNKRKINKHYIEARIRDWKNRVSDLYKMVSEELSKNDALECATDKRSIMNEELMIKFNVPITELPVLDVKMNRKLIASFKPIGLWTIGGNGRIDILTAKGAYILTDLSKDNEEPNWMLFTSTNKTNGKKFTSELINKIVE